VRLELTEAPLRPVPLNLRIPAWVRRATIKVNGLAAGVEAQPGTYARIERTWKAGDAVTLELPLDVQMIEADPLVAQARGQAAVQRGPLVYCLETADLPSGLDIDRLLLPREVKWSVTKGVGLLGGMCLLETEALVLPATPPFNGLYRKLSTGPRLPQKIRMIPYFAWNNRGPVDMSVWLPLR
jgi:DUF1680 family protein